MLFFPTTNPRYLTSVHNSSDFAMFILPPLSMTLARNFVTNSTISLPMGSSEYSRTSSMYDNTFPTGKMDISHAI